MGVTVPLISVIIPTYNRGATIERAIRSVLNQTYSNLELIVVDDASTDNTELIVSGIRDPRIRYIRHESNKGGGAARNTGIKLVKGEYIAFQDSDDEWLPQKLDKQMKVFEELDPELGVVYTSCVKYTGNNIEYFPDDNIIKAGSSGFIHEKFLRYNLVTTQTALVKSECFMKAGYFDERLPRLQDWELWIRISKHYKFILINEPLVNVFYTSNSITFNDFAYIDAMSIMLNKHRIDFIDNKAMTIQIGILARYAANKGNMLRNLEHISKNILSKIPARYSYLFMISMSRALTRAMETNTKMVSEYRTIADKRSSNLNLLSRWFTNKSDGKTMEHFFKENGYTRAAIYGSGDLGLKLYKEMIRMNVAITCFIDNAFAEEHIDDISVIRLADTNGNEADIVIVTPTYDYENIRNELCLRGFCSIISLEELINSMR